MTVRRHLARTGLAAAVLGSLAVTAGCETTETRISFQDNGIPRHQHAWQDWWNYQFVYYADENVYYEPFTETYFWYETGGWTQGASLPQALRVDRTQAQVVRLQSDELPFLQQTTVASWHPASGPVLPEWHDAGGSPFPMDAMLTARYEELQPELEPPAVLAEAEGPFRFDDFGFEGLPLWLRMSFELATDLTEIADADEVEAPLNDEIVVTVPLDDDGD